ncbi:cupin domain-containing protein [Hephaestia sp. GCM10023244]|uniref:cupin domain-containing protein n=1 Tax=unclassified Hephaestia TaxID=2631281 RepID=UPI0020774FCA|nr:cupin domain-containing protein [Hephaestia sp. MAHUQ-44]MCM8729648.1 cupin domain-containing protein [Hephaestia sp. MAHUQ-44]
MRNGVTMNDAPANLFAPLPSASAGEVFTDLLSRPGVRLERIVSQGQATPVDAPMVQETDEWVLLLGGTARLRLGDAPELSLGAGDHVFIAAGTPHWVTHTSSAPPAIWLALHLG